jgi:hypothetical protein
MHPFQPFNLLVGKDETNENLLITGRNPHVFHYGIRCALFAKTPSQIPFILLSFSFPEPVGHWFIVQAAAGYMLLIS